MHKTARVSLLDLDCLTLFGCASLPPGAKRDPRDPFGDECAGGGKGAGIGAGIGGLIGLGAILFTRGPDAELPRGSTLDIVIERDLTLDSSYIQFSNTGQAQPITAPSARPQ